DRGGFGSLRPGGEDLDRPALPRGAIEDAAPIWREARGPDVPAPEREPAVGRDRWFRGSPEKVAEDRAGSKSGRGEDGESQARDAHRRAASGGRSGSGARRKRFEIEGKVAGRLKAALGAFLQTVAHDPFEARREARVGHRKVRGILFEDRRHRVRRRVADEGA